MKNMMQSIRNLGESLSAAFELRATEFRDGISLIEAVAANDFETQLRAVTTSEEERVDIRQCALVCAQLGVSSDELPDLLSEAMSARWRGLTNDQ